MIYEWFIVTSNDADQLIWIKEMKENDMLLINF
jgi:hypothetical protein